MSIKITHLGNLHRVPNKEYNENDKDIRNIVLSQYKLAKFLITHPNIPVLEEAVEQDFYSWSLPDSMCNTIDVHVFPDGVPSKFSKLTYLQKNTLYELGGAKTLVCLGVLPKLYQAINPENVDKNAFKDIIGLNLRINNDRNFDKRETYALEYAKVAIKKHYNNKDEGEAFIIFGGKHDFKNEAESIGFIHDKIAFYKEEDIVSVSEEQLRLTQDILEILKTRNICINDDSDGFIAC